MRTVYVSIGNSDDKLKQAQWARFVQDVEEVIKGCAYPIIGGWLSRPDSVYQNACWCAVFYDEDEAKSQLRGIAKEYNQNSIAWAVAETTFLEPSS